MTHTSPFGIYFPTFSTKLEHNNAY